MTTPLGGVTVLKSVSPPPDHDPHCILKIIILLTVNTYLYTYIHIRMYVCMYVCMYRNAHLIFCYGSILCPRFVKTIIVAKPAFWVLLMIHRIQDTIHPHYIFRHGNTSGLRGMPFPMLPMAHHFPNHQLDVNHSFLPTSTLSFSNLSRSSPRLLDASRCGSQCDQWYIQTRLYIIPDNFPLSKYYINDTAMEEINYILRWQENKDSNKRLLRSGFGMSSKFQSWKSRNRL